MDLVGFHTVELLCDGANFPLIYFVRCKGLDTPVIPSPPSVDLTRRLHTVLLKLHLRHK